MYPEKSKRRTKRLYTEPNMKIDIVAKWALILSFVLLLIHFSYLYYVISIMTLTPY